jgi:hypothetical protein
MRKKIVALLILCIMSVVVASFELFVFRTTVQATSVDEIAFNPSAWVNKEVVVEGNLTGPLVFIPENAPPWNYELSSNGTRIGVLWNRDDVYNSVNVRVSGVVRQGRRAGGLLEPPPICYYIEAERIDVL